MLNLTICVPVAIQSINLAVEVSVNRVTGFLGKSQCAAPAKDKIPASEKMLHSDAAICASLGFRTQVVIQSNMHAAGHSR